MGDQIRGQRRLRAETHGSAPNGGMETPLGVLRRGSPNRPASADSVGAKIVNEEATRKQRRNAPSSGMGGDILREFKSTCDMA